MHISHRCVAATRQIRDGRSICVEGHGDERALREPAVEVVFAVPLGSVLLVTGITALLLAFALTWLLREQPLRDTTLAPGVAATEAFSETMPHMSDPDATPESILTDERPGPQQEHHAN